MIKSIDMVFENCECITIPAEAIAGFFVSNVFTRYTQTGPHKAIEDFILKVKPNIEITGNLFSETSDPLMRIEHADCTQLVINNEDRTVDNLYVTWADDDFYSNKTSTKDQGFIDLRNQESEPVFLMFHRSESKQYLEHMQAFTFQYFDMRDDYV